MNVPITSDLSGYQEFWAHWLSVALRSGVVVTAVIVGLLVVIAWLLVVIARRLSRLSATLDALATRRSPRE